MENFIMPFTITVVAVAMLLLVLFVMVSLRKYRYFVPTDLPVRFRGQDMVLVKGTVVEFTEFARAFGLVPMQVFEYIVGGKLHRLP